MSRTHHARPARPSEAVLRRVRDALLLDAEGQRAVQSLAAELGVSPAAVRAALARLGLRIDHEPVWCPERPARGRVRLVEIVRVP